MTPFAACTNTGDDVLLDEEALSATEWDTTEWGMVGVRFEVYLVRLDPTQGHEIQKTRPCVVISPDEMNRHLGTVIVAPLTTKGRSYPSRIPLRFQGKKRAGRPGSDPHG